MSKFVYLMICLPLLLLSACDVYEWPETSENVKLHIRLNYETSMTRWEHNYDGVTLKEKGLGNTDDNQLKYGKIRYIIRAYPTTEGQRAAQNYTREFVFTKDIAQGYDHEVTIDLPPGSYTIMVWSDLIPHSGATYFYDASNFAEIKLQGDYKGNTDHRDAFRGTNSITLVADIEEHLPDTLDIAMQRPLAKFELITTDLQKFIAKEIEMHNQATDTRGDENQEKIDLKNYKVVLKYSSFMPDTYNMMIDKPIDSSMGVVFQSSMNVLNDNEASLGFDYVFVNGKEAGISVQIGLYDSENRQLAFSEPINVPLHRSHHTVVRGSFLMQQASGGITINSDFDGNHNILIE